MSLDLRLIDEDTWRLRRNTNIQKEKWINSHWVTHLRDLVTPFKDVYDGIFVYDKVRTTYTIRRAITVAETTPIFQLFNLHSNTFTNKTVFQDNFYWKSSSIDDTILDRFKVFDLNKYKLGSNSQFDFEDYILLPLQTDAFYFNENMFISILKWSVDNKKTLVLKLHPFTTPDNHIIKILLKAKQQGLLKYTKIVTHAYNTDMLIEQAQKVWLFSSGVALNALLKGKPVSVFANSYYSPLCPRCGSPEQADLAQCPDEDSLYRYLSWFYHRFTIDIGAESAKDRFTQLFDHFYRDNKSLESYMSMDWK